MAESVPGPQKDNDKIPGKLKLYGSLLIILMMIGGMLLLGGYGMEVMSGLRAFVGAEGMWSKAQKNAGAHLHAYAESCNEHEHKLFTTELSTILGNKQARIELEKPEPNLPFALEGFIQGHNHRDDVRGMASLFRTFRSMEQIDRAIDLWEKGDGLITELVLLADEIRDECATGLTSTEAITLRQSALKDLNRRLNVLEIDFSRSLGEASRWAKGLLLNMLVGFALLAVVFCIFVFRFARKMIENTTKFSRDMKQQNWLQTGRTELIEHIQREQTEDELSVNTISFLAQRLDAQIGAFYVVDDEGALLLNGSYAYSNRKNLSNRFELGEGIVGQAALEKKPIQISDVPDDYIHIESGLGTTPPRFILVFPVKLEAKVLGVLELGRLSKFDDQEMEFLDQVSSNIAIAIEIVRARKKSADLLEITKTQSEDLRGKNEAITMAHEELQDKTATLEKSKAALTNQQGQLLAANEQLRAQQEELQASNEELEEQTQALKASEEELKSQQEELQASNEELEEHTQALKASEEELKSQQEELQATNDELGEKMNFVARQKEDIEAKQSEIEKRAEDLMLASKYKSEFLANMSHELRTPLNSLLILAQSLANNDKGNLDEHQTESARVIFDAGKDLLTLINDILDLSKVEAGKLELFIEDVVPSGLIRNLQSQFNPIAEKKGLEFLIDHSSDVPDTLKTDGKRTEQVLKNLLSNAFKFTEQGSVTIKVHRPPSEFKPTGNLTADNTVAFSVIDTGIGITKEQQEEIFKAFQQADGSISRAYGGTGLGLAISREFANLLGGTIYIESEKGKGSTFTLLLPIEGTSQPQPSTKIPSEIAASPISFNIPTKTPTDVHTEAKTARRRSGGSGSTWPVDGPFVRDDRKKIRDGDRTILIIEDDPEFAKVLTNFSRARNYKCLVAGTGSNGLKLATKHQPSGIILDMGLPDIDGMNVLEQLKFDLSTRHIPVHIISASDRQNLALQKGAVGFLQKPATLETLDTAFGRIEQLFQTDIKTVLVIEDDDDARRTTTQLIHNKRLKITAVATGEAAFKEMEEHKFDCVILDLNLPDMTGFDLLKKLKVETHDELPPVVVYTGQDLTREEHRELRGYAASIVVKGVNSPERLLDETSLFLHSVDESLSSSQRQMMQVLHDPEHVLKNRKVLLVDDDMRAAFALSAFLKKYGMEVILADNGAMAIEQLENEQGISIVLMDVMMPVMDGHTAIREIRKQRRFNKLPILSLTAKAMPEDRAKCIDAGANDYLTKPIDTEKLLSLMRVWLFEG